MLKTNPMIPSPSTSQEESSSYMDENQTTSIFSYPSASENEPSTNMDEKMTKPMVQPPSVSGIEPGLFLGNVRGSTHTATLRDNNINAIVSLINGPLGRWGVSVFRSLIPEHRHLWIECVDSSTQDLLVHMSNICDFIDSMLLPLQPSPSCVPTVQDMNTNITTPDGMQTPGCVLVHCDQGVSRSPTVVIAYLMRKDRTKLEDVLAMVKTKRKVRPSPSFMEQLRLWEEVNYQIWEDTEKKAPKGPYRAYLEKRAATLKTKGLTGNEPIRPINL